MVERSPMLWFYLQREDSGSCRKTEPQVCQEFLDTTFEKTSTTTKRYVLNAEKEYAHSSKGGSLPVPSSPANGLARKVYENTTPNKPMRKIFEKLDIAPSFQNANSLRIALTTSAFPYLESQGKEETRLNQVRNNISGFLDRLVK